LAFASSTAPVSGMVVPSMGGRDWALAKGAGIVASEVTTAAMTAILDKSMGRFPPANLR
jgi:hypothetical protein